MLQLETLESRCLLSIITASFFDNDGDLVQITVKNGTASITLDHNQGNHADIDVLQINSFGPRTSVKITVRGGETNIGRIVANNDLGAILGSRVNINQGIDVSGSLDRLTINNFRDNSTVHTSKPSSKAMTVKANQIGDNVHFDLASEVKTFQASSFGDNGQLIALSFKKVVITQGGLGADIFADSPTNGNIGKVLVKQNISGDVAASLNIKKVISQKGSISGDILAGTNESNVSFSTLDSSKPIFGNIGQIKAETAISGTIVARNDIKSVDVRNGSLNATIRAEQIRTIRALKMSQAIVSAATFIGNVRVDNDILDSHILSGYDIGLDGIAGSNDDKLNGGDIKKIRFGGYFANTHVAAGVVPIFSDLLPSFNGPSSSGRGSLGSTRGELINSENGSQLFGFYYAENIKIKLPEQGDFVIVKLLG